MNISQSEIDGFVVVSIDGEIDLNSSPQMRKAFTELVERKVLKIIVDFSKVAYIDSSGLATLIEMMQRLKKNQGHMYLVQMSAKIKSIFEITRLDKLFSICTNVDEAIKTG